MRHLVGPSNSMRPPPLSSSPPPPKVELICAASDLCKLKAVRAPLLWRLLTCTAALAAALLSCLLSLDMYFTARHFHHPQVRWRMRGGGEWRGKQERGWKVVVVRWCSPSIRGSNPLSFYMCMIPARQRHGAKEKESNDCASRGQVVRSS